MLKLAEHIPNNVGHKLYMANLFSTCDLLDLLDNRLKRAEKVMKSKKELEREGRGSMDYRVDINTNTTLTRWIDNGMVQA